jgi:hypothetical protein
LKYIFLFKFLNAYEKAKTNKIKLENRVTESCKKTATEVNNIGKIKYSILTPELN